MNPEEYDPIDDDHMAYWADAEGDPPDDAPASPATRSEVF